ncbi:MAG: PEP-CTERM sorting domain-containing protein, partial [Fimbriiglobus sp.]
TVSVRAPMTIDPSQARPTGNAPGPLPGPNPGPGPGSNPGPGPGPGPDNKPVETPEPGTLVMAAIGAASLFVARRRRR